MSFVPLAVAGWCRFCLSSRLKRIHMTFYAVARGKIPGIYNTWDECRANVQGFSKALYKSFKTKEEALKYCHDNGAPIFENKVTVDENEQINMEDDNYDESFGKSRALPVGTKKAPSETKTKSENIFNFASFSQRLTNLENMYKVKIQALEERIEALECARLFVTASDNVEADDNMPSVSKSSKPNLKRSSANTSQAEVANKKPKCSEIITVTSNQGTYDFMTDAEGYVIVYTDGACSNNGRGGGKAGVGVWFGENHPLNIGEPVQGRATNNMAEIQAATWAIQQAIRAGVKKVCVCTDSQFMVNCITKWIKKWKKNGWKTGTGAVINKEELEVLDKYCHYPGIDVKWEHVRGHCGLEGNEEADKLAREGALRYRNHGQTIQHPWQTYFST